MMTYSFNALVISSAEPSAKCIWELVQCRAGFQKFSRTQFQNWYSANQNFSSLRLCQLFSVWATAIQYDFKRSFQNELIFLSVQEDLMERPNSTGHSIHLCSVESYSYVNRIVYITPCTDKTFQINYVCGEVYLMVSRCLKCGFWYFKFENWSSSWQRQTFIYTCCKSLKNAQILDTVLN